MIALLGGDVKPLALTPLSFFHADLAKERERQLTMARANQTTGLINGRAANWAPKVVFSLFRALFRRQLTFPSCC